MRMPRALLVSASVLAAACAGASAPRAEVPTRPERFVMVVGEKSDAIGVERARDPSRAAVDVELHDGGRAWVEDWRVRDLDLPSGARLVVRVGDTLAVASLIERVDRMAWISVTGAQRLVPIGTLLAVLRRSEVIDEAVVSDAAAQERTEEEAPRAPIDPARVAAYDGLEVWLVARITSCSATEATLIAHERDAPFTAPLEQIVPLALAPGDRVFAPWMDAPAPALVIDVRGEVVRVRWRHGDDAWMPAEDVRRVLREPAAGGTRTRRDGCRAGAAAVLVRAGRMRVAGVVESCDATHATLVRADGTRERRIRSALSGLTLAPGDTVYAARRDAGDHAARVVAIDGGALQVRWEDDDREETIALETVLSTVEPAPRPRTPLVCPS